jgi:hypothetical protein
MVLQDLLSKKHFHYLMGYIKDNEFWAIHESASLDKIKELMEDHKRIFQQKQQYLIIKKTITYEQIKD